MSASADEPKLICRKCGAPLQRVGQFADQCVACLLELTWDEEEIPTASAERFDQYQVATQTDGTPVELGRGAMGITFKAFDTVLGNEVALKVLDARVATHPEARKRFLREARAAARLRHPNVASVFYGEVMSQHQCAPLPLEQLEAVPQPVVVLLEVLLEKDPRHRFQNPAELLKAIPTLTGAIDARRRITRQSLQKTPSMASRVGTREAPARLAPEKISIARLPVTGSDVFGRDEDLAFLDRAWASKDVNVVTIVAWAGVGKSTLANHWLRRMATDHYRSAELIFGWSFYRQGTTGDTSSADEFLDAALHWFGDTDPRLGTAWEKGERLAKLIAHRRTLLVLDGLEPLQNPPGPQEGGLREPSLQALLRELATFNRGLCVITSRLGDFETARRYAMPGVQIWRSGSVHSYPEEHFTPVVSCLVWGALSELELGEIASCHAMMREGISLARELNDKNSLAIALNFAAQLAANEGNSAKVDRLASDLIELSTRHNFVYWGALGAIYRGWARSASGDNEKGIRGIEHGIRDYQATGAMLSMPFLLTLKAEAFYLADRISEALEAISEAEALVERFEECRWCAELRRLRGVFLTALGGEETEIEASFRAAIRTANEQKSVSLAKRAEASYAEYRSQKLSALQGHGFRLPLW